MTVQAYHGSPNDFEEFSLDFLGTQSGLTGAGYGLYFSESESEAFTYGQNVFKCLLNLKLSLSNDEVTLKPPMIYKFLSNLNDLGENYFENFTLDYFPQVNDKVTNEAISSLLRTDSDTKLIAGIINSGIPVETVFNVLIDMGYNHTVDNDESFLAKFGTKHYIMYDLNDINILDKYTLEDRGINSNSMSISPRENIFKFN